MNMFAFKKPNERQRYFGCSDQILQGLRPGAFVIAPFDNNKANIFSIPATLQSDEEQLELLLNSLDTTSINENSLEYNVPKESLGKEAHKAHVNIIIERIRSGKLKKCVASRTIISRDKIDISQTFTALCNEYPASFVFFFHTDSTGTWMGATPELLLSDKKGLLTSMALAATHRADSNDSWTSKEIDEQNIVTQYIADVFKKHGLHPVSSGVQESPAGPVKHLRTVITAEEIAQVTPFSLISDLSPTPALCGYPKREALEIIGQTESWDRGYYGGYCGWIESVNDFDLFVNLRCMQLLSDRICLYVGGGIMADSDPEEEWMETENKATTLLKVLATNN